MPAQESKRWSFGRLFYLHSEGSYASPVHPATDAVCVKVNLASLAFEIPCLSQPQQIFERVQRCNFFSVGNRTCIVSYSHFRKLHLCTLVFLYLFFRRKITEIDRAVIPSEVVRLEPYPPTIFSNLGTFPRTPSKQ